MRVVSHWKRLFAAGAIGAALGAEIGQHWRSPAAASGGGVELHFAPDENLERVDVELIDQTRRTLDVAAYVMTDRAVIEAIERAARRGVAVRIWRDPEMVGKVGALDVAGYIAPDEPRVTMREKGPGPLMHLKGYCADGVTLRTGSANFSRSGLTAQDNDLIVLRDAGACARFEAKFAKAWGEP